MSLRTVVTAGALVLTAATPAVAAPNNNNSEKLRQAVTVEGVRAHQQALQFIADAAGGNRFAGTPGHEQSAAYVADQLRRAGYTPTFQEFTYDAFFERTPSTLQEGATSYVNGNDFRIMAYSGSGDVTGVLATPAGSQLGCAPGDFAGFPAGAVALVSRGSCTFRTKVTNAVAAGAAGILIYNNVPGVINGTLGATGLSAIPALGLTQALGQAMLTRMASGPVSVRVVTNTASEVLTTRNVFAETAGGDPDNVVMVGAHLDSVTAGPGINDNGSGSAAILETAIQMQKVSPRNKVRFAWWSAEESGLIGAAHYVGALPQAERDRIAAYLNFDMIGSPNFARFVYDGDNSTGESVIPGTCSDRCRAGSDVVEELFHGYFDQVAGLASEPTPFNGRSDYGPFINADIPAGGLFTGAEGVKTPAQAAKFGGVAGQAYDPCYHAACDDFGNVSLQGLDQMTDAVAHVTITLAQSTEVLNGRQGKGNFASPARAEGSEGSGGGAGGLHDDHDHFEE